MKLIRFTAVFMMIGILFSFYQLNAQKDRKDKAKFIEQKNEFWEEIRQGIDEFQKKPAKDRKAFKMDFDGLNIPKSKDEFKFQWHNDPLSQGSTGTCWCFSTTSFMESEAFRLNKIKVKISEMHTVYWEYVEKAKRFVKEKGNSEFGEGGEANGLMRIWKKYGCVPEETYTGMLPGQKFHDHSKMYSEMKNFLNYVKENSVWNDEIVISTIKSILNTYMGEPPVNFSYQGKNYNSADFLKDFVKLNPDDYVDFMSLMEKEYFTKAEYEVPDNWWHSADYYNIPLDVYMETIKKAVRSGYTMEIGGDVSEAGYASFAKVGMVPSFDIPSSYIDEYSRQFRFSNGTSTDDHGIHVVGYTEKDGITWFLIKDSGSGSFNGGMSKGYYFYHEDYIKLKMLSFIVHKSAVEDLLKKFGTK